MHLQILDSFKSNFVFLAPTDAADGGEQGGRGQLQGPLHHRGGRDRRQVIGKMSWACIYVSINAL